MEPRTSRHRVKFMPNERLLAQDKAEKQWEAQKLALGANGSSSGDMVWFAWFDLRFFLIGARGSTVLRAHGEADITVRMDLCPPVDLRCVPGQEAAPTSTGQARQAVANQEEEEELGGGRFAERLEN